NSTLHLFKQRDDGTLEKVGEPQELDGWVWTTSILANGYILAGTGNSTLHLFKLKLSPQIGTSDELRHWIMDREKPVSPRLAAFNVVEQEKVYYEFDPKVGPKGAVLPTTYRMEVPEGEMPAANPHAQELMEKFDRFESLNFEVLSGLNKQEKTVGDFNDLLSKMRQMLNAYENLFKKQRLDEPLENIAAAPSDLEGGRAVAQIFLRIENQLKQGLEKALPGARTTDRLPEAVRSELERFDGDKSSTLIGTPAEHYSPAQQQGVSFAELLNIVHQKGVRNLSDIVAGVTGGRRMLTVKIRRGSAPPTGPTPAIPPSPAPTGDVIPPGTFYIPPIESPISPTLGMGEWKEIQAFIQSLKSKIHYVGPVGGTPGEKPPEGTPIFHHHAAADVLSGYLKNLIKEAVTKKNLAYPGFVDKWVKLHNLLEKYLGPEVEYDPDFGPLQPHHSLKTLFSVIVNGGSHLGKLSEKDKNKLLEFANQNPTSELDAALFAVIKQLLKDSEAAGFGAQENESSITINYLDARKNPDKEPPLPAHYVALAFAKGQLVHQNKNLFTPENALILSDERRAIVGMRLGAHSARIQFALLPVQEGGRVAVNYTDSGPSFAPGSDIRIKALAEAFAEVGFKVHQEGYHLDAYFDKDSGASSIDELPEKLEFAIQALSSTLDLDTAINKSKGAELHVVHTILTGDLEADGYLIRSRHQVVQTGGPKGQIKEQTIGQLAPIADFVGVDVLPPYLGQRSLDRLSEKLSLLFSRGALLVGSDGSIQKNPAYEEASKASPIERFFKIIGDADAAKLKELRNIAAVARTVEGFTQRRTIGAVGPFHIEQLTLPLLGDQVVFYALRHKEDLTIQSAYAVLGEFPFDQSRYDRFRGKLLPSGNLISPADLEEILVPQNMAASESLAQWFREHEKASVAALIAGEISDEITPKYMYEAGVSGTIFNLLPFSAFLNLLVPEFSKDTLKSQAFQTEVVSWIYLEGVTINQGKSLGRLVPNVEGKKAEDFKNGILVAAYTDNKDDESIKMSSGVIVTTGSVLSHAAIRSREHEKPAVILNGAEFRNGKLHFKRFKGEEVKREFQIGGEPITYYELSDYTETEEVLKEGDLVYLDAKNGILYLLARAEEKEAIEQYERYRKSFGFGAEAEPSRERLKELKALLKEVTNPGLLKAIVDELIYRGGVPIAALEEILADAAKEPARKGVIVGFLRTQALQAIKNFKEAVEHYKETASKSKDIEQVYLMVDEIVSQQEHLQHMIQLANGDWTAPVTSTGSREMIDEVIKIGKAWLSIYQKELQGQFQHFRLDPLNGLTRLLRISASLGLAGISAELVRPDLVEKMKELMEARASEVESQKGRGIVWKKDLKDRFSRPIAGGKASHSAEIVQALGTLKKAGALDESVVYPEGFAIQAEEFRLWHDRGRPDELAPELKQAIALGYRDIVIEQAEGLLSFLEADQRTVEHWKVMLRPTLKKILENLKRVSDPLAIDAIVQAGRASVLGVVGLAEQFSKESDALKTSQSFLKRGQVFGAVAVRSSGLREDSLKEAMAGLRKSPVNVIGGLDDVHRAVREVWESGAESVLIEEMINAKVSGVSFSTDPVQKRTDRIRITAAHGLAKGLVDHDVTSPDSYVVAKEKIDGFQYNMLSSETGTKEQMVILDVEKGGTKIVQREADKNPVLKTDDIALAAKTVDAFSKYFGFQVDMEWSIDSDGRFVVLQARPITTIARSIERGRQYLLGDAGFGVGGASSPAEQFVAAQEAPPASDERLGQILFRRTLERRLATVAVLADRYPSLLPDLLKDTFGRVDRAAELAEAEKQSILKQIESLDLSTLIITDLDYLNHMKIALSNPTIGSLLERKLSEVHQVLGLFANVSQNEEAVLAERLREELNLPHYIKIVVADHQRPVALELKSTAISLLGEIPDNLRIALGVYAEQVASDLGALSTLLNRFAELEKITRAISIAA
ncbi:MAG: hypothetical protein HY587_03060, partial [Candidatus Omnitrophica bacterium]|nr:hypothetical protein [Candidatus Omnitrophota bacterium]